MLLVNKLAARHMPAVNSIVQLLKEIQMRYQPPDKNPTLSQGWSLIKQMRHLVSWYSYAFGIQVPNLRCILLSLGGCFFDHMGEKISLLVGKTDLYC